MKELKFKCTLLSDVILNSKSATNGPNETLDFIPGANFLGIAAGELYSKISPEDSLRIFHSGKVRFGDAHPSVGDSRSAKVAASMFYPKLSSPEQELYIHHHIDDHSRLRHLQLKQCRKGFYDFTVNPARRVATSTNSAIKSAYDREQRRAKDEQLFMYESLDKGLTMYFAVEVDDPADAPLIRKALTGIRRIGRSRSAQYGLVKIEEAGYREVGSAGCSNGLIAIYADSRLIFLDDDGLPTFQPTPDQLGVEGEILWEKSQIRTFRYAPWNFKRQSFDTDRCGIEKGSVIVVRPSAGTPIPSGSRYVGSYNCEGFGRVIYNPSFLEATDGKALMKLESGSSENVMDIEGASHKEEATQPATPLLKYLLRCRQADSDPYEEVNEWIASNRHLFIGDSFASQWGAIRAIAQSTSDVARLKARLFEEPDGYLVHGVAKEKWEERRRLEKLREFVYRSDPGDIRKALVNLATEMAKKRK